jgi:hypothetical protein
MSEETRPVNDLSNKTIVMPAETYQRLINFLVSFPYNQVFQCLEDLKKNASEIDSTTFNLVTSEILKRLEDQEKA